MLLRWYSSSRSKSLTDMHLQYSTSPGSTIVREARRLLHAQQRGKGPRSSPYEPCKLSGPRPDRQAPARTAPLPASPPTRATHLVSSAWTCSSSVATGVAPSSAMAASRPEPGMVLLRCTIPFTSDIGSIAAARAAAAAAVSHAPDA